MLEASEASLSMIMSSLRISYPVRVRGRIEKESKEKMSPDGSQVQSQAAGQGSGKKSSVKSPVTTVKRTKGGEVGAEQWIPVQSSRGVASEEGR